MMKAFSFYIGMFIGTSILLGVLAGGGGIQSTYLTSTIDADDTTISVASTSGFLSSGTLYVDNEVVTYSGATSTTFTGVSRGTQSTKADSHNSGNTIYTEDAGVINLVFGFNIGTLWNDWGIFAVPVMIVKFFTTTIPYLAQGNMQYMFTGGLSIIADIWIMFGAGFIVMLIFTVLSLFGNRN